MNAALAFLLLLQTVQEPLPEVVRRSRLDRSRGVDFHALVAPDTVFVGQQATYELGVFIDGPTRQRLRRNPEFLPPESRAMLAYDLPDKTGGFTGTIDGRTMEVHVFRRALFPLTPGRYDVPEARLTYALPQSASFFSREESFTLRSEAVSVVAMALPAAGRPADWLGAVGSWRASARVDTTARRPGEPFVLTLRVEGQGNVTLLARPAIALDWATVVAADERVRLDSSATLLRGSKEFDWLVTPREGGRQVVPALRYPYFNPYSRRYEIAQSDPIAVRAVATAIDSTAAPPPQAPVASADTLSLRPTLGAEAPAPLGDSTPVLVLALLAPLPALGAWWLRRPRRPRRVPSPRERLEQMTRGTARASTADVRRAFLDALAQRV
ncbi:MAG: BatD family protein, partial [Gemmatimonadetes bacterium]|nr:BatD family protein [Gemmatimonadota bacterium]